MTGSDFWIKKITVHWKIDHLLTKYKSLVGISKWVKKMFD
jgi:hypothetical protein